MNIRKKIVAAGLMLGIAAPFNVSAQQHQCATANKLGAIYEIEMSPEAGSSATKPIQKLELWRSGKQVAIRYPQKQITELWEQTKNNQLHMVRYFDAHQRGIEYQPIEIKGKHDWSVKHQLISDAFKGRMTPGEESGKGCDQKQHYSLHKEHENYHLVWLKTLQLPEELSVKSQTTGTHWTLKQLIKDEKTVDKAFDLLAQYQTVDFTDIGDMENDPFLRKMINLGFVEHGHSGFYDAEGNDIGSHGH